MTLAAEKPPPSFRQIIALGSVLAAVIGGGQYLTVKDVARDARKYTDAAEARAIRMLEKHETAPIHPGAVSKEVFDEFRRAIETALANVATKDKQDMILDRQRTIEDRLRDVERKVGGGGG